MLCELFFYYNQNNRWEELSNHIKKIPEPRQIITDSNALTEFLKKNGIDSSLLDEIVPEKGATVHEVDKFSKKILKEYSHIFHNVTFSDIEIINGIEYQFLRQLHLLGRTKILLENKVNTIFIFERFYPIYFAIIKLSTNLGYENNSEIKFLGDNKIEHMSSDNQGVLNYRNKFALTRSIRYLKSSSSSVSAVKRLKKIISFSLKIFSLLSKMLAYRILSVINIDFSNSILKKIEKKIATLNLSHVDCTFFITASREDIYLKPLYSIFQEFIKRKSQYLVLTSDLATGTILSERNIPFVNLFEEVKLLIEEIKRSKEDQRIREQMEINFKQNSSILGINELFDFLLEEAYRCIATIIICEHVIKFVNPKSMFAAADGEMLENLAISVCRKYKIPSFSMLPAVVHTNPIMSEWFHADKISVYGIHALETLSTLGYNKERIVVTGNPKYDYFKSLEREKSKKFLEENYHIDSKKKVIVVGMSAWYNNDEVWMSDLIKFCSANDFELIIKIHPMYKFADNELSESKINAISKSCQKLKYLITYDIDIYVLLSGADLVITDFSNVGIEAVLLEKPLLIINFTNNTWQYLRLDKYGASIYIDGYWKLEKTLIEILKEGKHLFELEKGRERIIEQYNFGNDGKASERLFNLLTKDNEKHTN